MYNLLTHIFQRHAQTNHRPDVAQQMRKLFLQLTPRVRLSWAGNLPSVTMYVYPVYFENNCVILRCIPTSDITFIGNAIQIKLCIIKLCASSSSRISNFYRIICISCSILKTHFINIKSNQESEMFPNIKCIFT